MKELENALAQRKGITMVEFFWIIKGKMAGSDFPTLEELEDLYRSQGIRILVPLQERDDLAKIRALGYLVHPMFVEDFTPPGLSQLEDFCRLVDNPEGKPVLAHCWGGYGRTGTVLAAYLIRSEGLSVEEAVARVRAIRPHSVETKTQLDMLERYVGYLKELNQFANP